MSYKQISVILSSLLIACSAVASVDESPVPFVFSPSDLTENLSQVSVSQLTQDADGFIWILTQEGLNRYDGIRNLVFRADVSDPYSLSNDIARAVVVDERGDVWIGTLGGGLNKFDRASHGFQVIRNQPTSEKSDSSMPLSNHVRSLSRGLEGRLWVGYQDSGLSTFDPVSLQFRHFSPVNYPELEGAPVTTILETRDGKVYVATDGAGLLILDMNSGAISKFAGSTGALVQLESDSILSLHSENGQLWLGTTDRGVYKVEPDKTVTNYPGPESVLRISDIRAVAVYDILETEADRLMLATSHGIAVFDAKREELHPVPIRGSSSSSFRINSLGQDSSGLIWAGSYVGIFTGFNTAITHLGKEDGLTPQNVLSVSRYKDSQLLVGTESGISVLGQAQNSNDFRMLGLLESIKSPVTTLLAEQDFVWAGSDRQGLMRINKLTGETTNYSSSGEGRYRISHDLITKVYRDSYANLWVGTFGGGLNLLRDGASRFVSLRHDPENPNTLSSDVVLAIYQEKNGDLWVGTDQGLNRYNFETGNFDHFSHEENTDGTLSNPFVFSIYEDTKARLWIGTQGGGLNLWEPFDRKRSLNRFIYFQTNIGLPSNNIYAVQGDELGNIWLATSGGLTRFNLDLNDAKNLTADDGLQSNDFNYGASFQDFEGRLYFGGTSGLSIFDPAKVTSNSVPPKIALTRVSLGNEQIWFDVPYNELETIELQPDDYLLGFEFAALDFRAPHRNQYRYQMVGLDSNWVDLGNRNTLDFSKLPMGQYVLRVQGSNSDGVWSPEGIALNIFVHPPMYLTWYAFVAYTLALLLLIAAFFYRQRLKAHEQMQYQMQLEDDVRARTLDLRRSNEKLQIAVEEMGRARAEAEEANQAKSEFMAALSHEIRTPMHGVLGMTDLLLHSGLSDRQLNFAESAHVSANELLGLIDNILDFSKIEAGKLELEETTFNLREMVENLCYLYGELAQSKNLELNLIFNLDLRRQLYGDPVRLRQVLQNLLSNAIKFTKRGSVNLTVNEVSRQDKTLGVQFLVEDTGIGMNQQTIEHVFEAFSQADSSTTRQFGGTGLGLSIAKQLIDLMGGELDVNSRPGVGTTMAVNLSLMESPIYTEQLSTGGIEEHYAEVVAPMPETRAMFRSQLEAAGLRVRECSQLEELAAVAEHPRIVLVDTGSLYTGASIALVENLSQDAHTVVVLITPLSGIGIPAELKHLPHTTKPARLAGLLSDLRAAESWELADEAEQPATLLRFNKRILLVEDIAANQEIARAMLESFGCTVAIARNGEVALEMYQQDDFDLVLMDCQMPVMDGFEATRHIRQLETRRPGGSRIPVVALTAGKTETEKERCYASGMDRILFKPYSTAELNELFSHYFVPVGQVEPRRQEKATAKTSDLLDMKAVENIRNIDVDTGSALLAAVFENFKVDGKLKLDELREHSDDADMLGAGAHAIKSMSLNMGAKALSDYCRRCESRWKGGRIEDAAREIEVLAGHFRDATRALEQLLAADGEAVD